MPSERIIRLVLFTAVAAAHALLIIFLAFKVSAPSQEAPENARVMKLVDLAEQPPPPPPPEEKALPEVEAIAENMIETGELPLQTIVAPGTITTPSAGPSWDDYLPAHQVSSTPKFDRNKIAAAIEYPPIARRSGIEGNVYLELFVDKNGAVTRVRILKEEPPDRGFGEAAVRAFTGMSGEPASANGKPVSCRYRYPVTFKLR